MMARYEYLAWLSGFWNAGEQLRTFVPPSRGGGQGFESPRVHTLPAYDLRLANELERHQRRPTSDQYAEREFGRRVALENRPCPPHER